MLKQKEIKVATNERLVEEFEWSVVVETNQTNSRRGVSKKQIKYTQDLKKELLNRLGGF